jgi:DNA-binding transcriptional MerR regulator
LHPSDYSGAGYRLYDENDLEKLQQILLFRELEFPLKDIREIINSLDFDREKALRQQIELLTLKRDHINNLITLARSIQLTGGKGMDFAAFDTGKIDEYARQAKESWGVTREYKEFEAKNSNRTLSELKSMGDKLMALIAEFGMMKDKDPADPAVQEQVKKNDVLRVQTFGNFEVFKNNEVLHFQYNKTKELFAYLIDRCGARTSNGEILGVLWEDDANPERKASYLQNLRADMMSTLNEAGFPDVIVRQRGTMAVVPDKMECDLYEWKKDRNSASSKYTGEYMNQFSWAEYSKGALE